MSTLLAPPKPRPRTPSDDAPVAPEAVRPVPASHDAGASTATAYTATGHPADDGASLEPARLTIPALAATQENLPRHSGSPAVGHLDQLGSPGDEPGLVAGDTSPAAVFLARLAPTGRRVQATALSQIAALVTDGAADAWSMPWHRLTYAHTHAVRAHLAGRYAPATANRMLAALRGVLREAWRLGLMDGEQYQRATDLAAVRGQRLPAGRAVTAGELSALFASCPPTPGGVRDAALIAVLYGTGVRRSEAAALDLADVNLATAAVTIKNGKGAKSRLTYAPAGALAALTTWLEIRGNSEGPLFWPVRRGGQLQPGHRLSGQAIRAILHRRAAAARVAPFGPHDLRRSTVGDLLDAGADIATVARLAGHSNVQVTMTYDRRPEATKARAASLLHVPYTVPVQVPATPPSRLPAAAARATVRPGGPPGLSGAPSAAAQEPGAGVDGAAEAPAVAVATLTAGRGCETAAA
ncbi:MAG: tyrosine-type recombinase/integrase [Nocardioidaceae bacterium]